MLTGILTAHRSFGITIKGMAQKGFHFVKIPNEEGLS
jgi:hypothetical protein